MGADYLKGKAKRERKGWRDGRDRLKQPRLDDRLPPDPQRVVKFSAHPQSSLKVGDSLVLQKRGDALAAYSGLACVAESTNATEAIQRAVESTNGMATGRVCGVDRNTGVFDILVDSATHASLGGTK